MKPVNKLEAIEVKVNPMNQTNQMNININDNEDSSLLPSSNTKPTKYALIEPTTHVLNRNFFEKLISSCINESQTTISLAELQAYYGLKVDANINFEFENENHNNLVRELWYILNNEKLHEIKNPGWKLRGFQNVDPRTDFRGGGVLSLMNLIEYSKKYRIKINEMTVDDTTDFLFGITSINVTYYLIKYYHLADYLEYDKDKADICSRKALKTFCSLLVNDEDIFHKIHDMLLTDVYDVWLLCKTKWTDATILDFKSAMDMIIKKYDQVTKGTIHKDFDTIKRQYLILSNNVKRRATY